MGGIVRRLADFWRALFFLTSPISDLVLNFVYRLCMGETKPLPLIDNKILLMSAVELAEKIRTRQLKCEDVMRAYVKRCRVVHPFINAVVDARYEDAIEESKTVDRLLETTEKSPEEIKKTTPLLGVPFTCKEAIGVKGLAQINGMLTLKGRVAEKDSDAAALYRKAGAIPVTVTNVPQMCMWWDTANLAHGITKNPFDHSRIVGGSSGGESALLTSAGAIIGIGNDIGGSIRIPSCFNGIYGHKPSIGVVSNKGEYTSNEEERMKTDKFNSTGPMCRYAEDLPLLLKVLSNNNERLKLQDKVDFRNVKIYYIEEFPDKYIATIPAIKKSMKKAITYFEEEFGIQAIPLKINELEFAFDTWLFKFLETGILPFKDGLAGRSGKICLWWELVKSIFRLSNHTIPAIFYAMIERREKDHFYHDCLKRYDEIQRRFEEIFQEDSIVLVPTHPEPAPHYHMAIPKFLNIAYTGIFNILGYPSTNIPAGVHGRLPFGIQAVSGRFKDHLTIAAALELDKLFGGWKVPCEINV